jgi:hypothetical protein
LFFLEPLLLSFSDQNVNLAIVVVDELATYTIWLAMDVNIFSLCSAWIQWAFIFLINYSSKLITDL